MENDLIGRQPPAPAPRLYNRPPRPEPPATPPPKSADKGLSDLLAGLDTEQWLLLGLALLLFHCGGHTELTLALLYLAM